MDARIDQRPWSYGSKLAAAVFVVVGLLALWQLSGLLLLVFASLLVSLALRRATGAVAFVTRLGRGAAFAVATLLIAAAITGFFVVLGAQLQSQLADLWEQLPELIQPLAGWLGLADAEEWLGERAEAMLSQTSVINSILGLSSAAAGLLANLILVLVAGFYIALNPDLYRRGFVLLFTRRARPTVDETLTLIDKGLGRWLVGQLAAMLMVGVLTYAGLTMLGIPSALALAAIAGVLEFVPYVGPILSALPAIGLALSESPRLAIWVVVLYLAIQQLEGNLITPLVHRRTVSLPPAITLFAILAFGILFGTLGVLLATPLAVVGIIAVKHLWVREALHEPVSLDEPEPKEKADG